MKLVKNRTLDKRFCPKRRLRSRRLRKLGGSDREGEFYSNVDKQLLQEFQHATWPRRQEIIASLSDPRLRQLGRRLVAFYSPELLTADEMALFKAYLRDKWSAPNVPETEWMTFEKAEAALGDLRTAVAVEPRELDAIASFLRARCAGGA